MELAASFRAFTDDELLRLLNMRPELGERMVSSFVDLASRAVQANSLILVLTSLNTFEREILDALVHLDGPGNAIDIASLPAQPADPALIDPILDRLRVLGLVVRANEATAGGRIGYEVLKEVRRLIPAPFLLHPRLDKLLDRYSVPDLRTMAINVGLPVKTVGKVGLIGDLVELLTAPDGVADVLSRGSHEVESLLQAIHDDLYGMLPLDTRPWSRSTIPDAVGWLLGHGLLLPISSDTVVIAREIALSLRGGAPTPGFRPSPPTVELKGHRNGVRVARQSGVELTPNALIEAMTAIGTTWARTSPAPLRTDGVGVKEVRALEKALGIDENSIARIIELGGLAGLFAIDLLANRIGPTAAFDAWLAESPIDRWCTLVFAWAQATSSLSRVVRHEGEKSEAPLSPLWDVDFTEVWRRTRVIEALGSAEPEESVDVMTVAHRARWFSPDKWGPATDYVDLVVNLVEEASLIGVVSSGSLTELARALWLDLTGEALEHASAKVFPRPVETFTVSGDLSAIAPGELTSTVAVELGLIADLVSKGGASVYRFTEASIRQALDHGRTTADIHEFLRAHAKPGVPQPLTYLIDDVGRRYGSVRVGAAMSYVRSDDPVGLAEILRSKKTAKLKLQQLAPTVAVSMLAPAKIVKGLREAGFLPVEEGDQGVVIRPTASTVGSAYRPRSRSSDNAKSKAIWETLRTSEGAGNPADVPSSIKSLIHTLRAKG